MSITPLPDPPSRRSPATFADKADELLGALPTFVTEANALAEQISQHVWDHDIKPDIDATRSLGSLILRYLQGHFVNLTLGGVSRNSWPSTVAGSNGNVFLTGSITLNGQDGVTVTHNYGNTSYLVKTNVSGLNNLCKTGDIAYVKAANTVVIYNSGISGITADVEISAVA